MFSKLRNDDMAEDLFNKKRRRSHIKLLGNVKDDWEADAEDGVLSYSKMKYEENLRHPRKQVDGSFEKLPCCTSIGRLGGWNKDDEEKNEFEMELGPGIAMYFKTLRTLSILLLVFTVLYIPLFIVYSKTQFNLYKGQYND